MVKNEQYHSRGDKSCNHDECKYMRRNWSYLRMCYECNTGFVHCSESDWIDYDFGTKSGQVYYETICDACGIIDRDANMPAQKSKLDIKFERRVHLNPTDDVRYRAFVGFWNSLPDDNKKQFINGIQVSGELDALKKN